MEPALSAKRVGRSGERFANARHVVAIVVLALAAVTLLLVLINTLPWTMEWDLWTVLTAVGTVGATLVAVALALRAALQDKAATARVVAAWVTDDYQPRSDGSSYHRTTHVHIANEGNEPVFDARVNIVIGRDQTPIGPLSVPMPISVLPPRRELVFDISTPLLAHSDSWSPRATLYFTDPKGRRWIREADGHLRDASRDKARWSEGGEDLDEKQLGDTQSVLNPMMIAFAFLAGLRDLQTTPAEMQVVLDPVAGGWSDTDWGQLRSELENYQPTSMVDYPAPRIARIKLSGDVSLEGRRVEGEGLELPDYMFMTLTLTPERGWRVFSVGNSVPPDAIDFGGSLGEDIRPQRDEGDA